MITSKGKFGKESKQRQQHSLENLLQQVGELTKDNNNTEKEIDEISGLLLKINEKNKIITINENNKVVLGSSSSLIIKNDDDDVSYDLIMNLWELPCPPSMPF